MKRIPRLSALILCSAMLASLCIGLSGAASAAEKTRTTPVVPRLTVGGTSAPAAQPCFRVDATGAEYTALNAALADAASGQTVSLLRDASVTESAVLPAGVTLSLGACTLTVPGGVTLNAASGRMTAGGSGKLTVSGAVTCSSREADRLADEQVELKAGGSYDGFVAPAGAECYRIARSMEKSMSLNLNDATVVNYYLADPGFASAYAVVDGVKTPMVKEGANWYLAVRTCLPEELGQEITVRPVGVDSAGVHRLGKANTISVRWYAEQLLAGTTWHSSDKAALDRTMIALLNYGAAAQRYAGYQTDDLANRNIGSLQSLMTVYTPESLDAHRVDRLEKNDPQGLCASTSCLPGGSLALRFDLALPENIPDRADLTFRVSYRNYNDLPRTIQKSFAQLSGTDASGARSFEVPGMAAADAETNVTLTVCRGSTAIATVTDSIAGCYARTYDTEALRELSDAALIYGLSARDLFYAPVEAELDQYELPVIRVSR